MADCQSCAPPNARRLELELGPTDYVCNSGYRFAHIIQFSTSLTYTPGTGGAAAGASVPVPCPGTAGGGKNIGR